MTEFDQKLLECFGDLVIDKALVRELGVRNARTIPSFVEEWLITRNYRPGLEHSDVKNKILDFISKHLPAKTDKEIFMNQLYNGQQITILDSFSAYVDLTRGRRLVKIPSLDIRDARVENDVIDANLDLLGGGLWGAGRLVYYSDKKFIQLVEFKPMQSGRVSLNSLVDARKRYSTEEWIQVLIRTMGLEPASYTSQQRRSLIQRLIPLVHPNVNMMELAPKGTGKSFVFTNLSRYVWLNSGGALSQAQLFLNQTTKEVGLLGGRYDLLVLDEGQSIDFQGADNIHAKFKDYLESGRFSVGSHQMTSECGLMILANIELFEGHPRHDDYITELPQMFHDSALMDRFHGIIAGWEIPRFQTDSAAKGCGFKADVFGEYAHQIRHASADEFPYGNLPANLRGDSRDVNAVKKVGAALSKLLMLNPGDPDYEEYVLKPAMALRERVRSQLALIDPHEFSPRLKVEYTLGSE